ncbi:DoxX family protein [Gordonia hydrophobica]|uniref:DoxX family protein n=1 Tax=Gordonia hydrophobica TaxID=40516 RepID=A0ABZ2U1Z2_9ACTN|nr:DoxX family protein [Gordonia hydrophobica]MBM7369266.1 putative oxidoreductase [Gordonia hydrophobica]
MRSLKRSAGRSTPLSRQGLDAVRLLLRASVGGTMVAHGLKHATSLTGTAGWFESIGFRKPKIQAAASAVVETGAGVALIAGAGTPLAAAAVVGTMAVAGRSVHVSNGFFITAEGWEYVANLAVAAVVLAGVGPGRWSVDRRLGIDSALTGDTAAAFAAGVGAAGALGQLAAFHRPGARP